MFTSFTVPRYVLLSNSASFYGSSTNLTDERPNVGRNERSSLPRRRFEIPSSPRSSRIETPPSPRNRQKSTSRSLSILSTNLGRSTQRRRRHVLLEEIPRFVHLRNEDDGNSSPTWIEGRCVWSIRLACYGEPTEGK